MVDHLGWSLMARIRTIKPDAFTSETLSEIPRGTRWTFAGLWTYSDDAGRARDDIRLIKAALYPLDDATTLSDVRDDIATLASIGGVCRYVVNGRNYLHMPKWTDHQKINRPTGSRLPACPEHEGGANGYVLESDPSMSPHGGFTEDSPWEGKGREGNRDLSCAPADADGATEVAAHFAEFWDAYGKKVGKKAAEQKYAKAIKKADPGLILAAARSYIAGQRGKGKHPDFTKDPATWLHGEHWADEDSSAAPADGRIELPPLPRDFFS